MNFLLEIKIFGMSPRDARFGENKLNFHSDMTPDYRMKKALRFDGKNQSGLKSRVLLAWLRRKWFSFVTVLECSPLEFHSFVQASGELNDEVSITFKKESILTEDILG